MSSILLWSRSALVHVAQAALWARRIAAIMSLLCHQNQISLTLDFSPQASAGRLTINEPKMLRTRSPRVITPPMVLPDMTGTLLMERSLRSVATSSTDELMSAVTTDVDAISMG